MDILMIDLDKYGPEEVEALIKKWNEVTQNQILILPKDIGVMRDLSIEQITSIRDWLNEILENGVNQEEENN